MIIECFAARGNCVPGDQVEVPDGAIFDTAHFTEEVAEAEAEKQPAAPAAEATQESNQ